MWAVGLGQLSGQALEANPRTRSLLYLGQLGFSPFLSTNQLAATVSSSPSRPPFQTRAPRHRPEKRRDVRPRRLPLPSASSPSSPHLPEPPRPPLPGQNPNPPPAPLPPRPPRLPAARRRGGGGVGGGRAAGPALHAGGRFAERQPRAAPRAGRGGDVGGRAVAGGLPGGAARRRAAFVVPQRSLGPTALLRAARPLRPLPRPLPRGHAAGVRPQARPQPARRIHGHRHHHHDPAPAATHVMAPAGHGIGGQWLVC